MKNIMCQNCSTLYDVSELDPLDDVLERVAPGETMPWGQCPDQECGAVCYPVARSADSNEITKETIEEHEKVQNKLFEAAQAVFETYHALYISMLGEKGEPYSGLTVSSLDATTIQYDADEYWSYGGHEHYSFSLPTSYIYEDWKPSVITKFQEQSDKRKKEIETAQDIQRKQDLATLEKLKAKYGDLSHTRGN